jgi:hypothetical protein
MTHKKEMTEWPFLCRAPPIFSVLDIARAAADRSGEWRNWAFLTLQIQLAAERLDSTRTQSVIDVPSPRTPLPEEPDSVWAKAKAHIRSQIPEKAFLNWFVCTRELVRCGSRIEVGVPDEVTSEFLSEEYHQVTRTALSDLGIDEIRFVVFDPLLAPLNADSDTAEWTDRRAGFVTA